MKQGVACGRHEGISKVCWEVSCRRQAEVHPGDRPACRDPLHEHRDVRGLGDACLHAGHVALASIAGDESVVFRDVHLSVHIEREPRRALREREEAMTACFKLRGKAPIPVASQPHPRALDEGPLAMSACLDACQPRDEWLLVNLSPWIRRDRDRVGNPLLENLERIDERSAALRMGEHRLLSDDSIDGGTSHLCLQEELHRGLACAVPEREDPTMRAPGFSMKGDPLCPLIECFPGEELLRSWADERNVFARKWRPSRRTRSCGHRREL